MTNTLNKSNTLVTRSLEKQIIIYISIAASVVTGLTVLAFIGGNKQYLYLYPIGSVIISFTIVYFITKHYLYRFIRNQSPLNENSTNNTQPLPDIENISDTNIQKWEILRLKEMEKYRKEFLGNVSHELKTPIFNIQGYVSTLLDGGLEDESINRKYLERADKSINRMISIVEDLETITRLESGELKLHLEEFNIIQLIEEVIEAQEMKSKTKKIKLKLDKIYEKPVLVWADKQRIFQVISNLLVNSIIYSKENGKTVVSVKKGKKKVDIKVEDNGMGISENDLPRIFERFYRVDKSRSREQGGTGLGLAIVKHILEGHNESITVQSQVGKGTIFEFALPRTSHIK